MEIYYIIWKPNQNQQQENAKQKQQAQGLLQKVLLQKGYDIQCLQAFRTPKGRPGYLGLPFDFNISHTAGMVACAVGLQVGIDCEAPRVYSQRLAQRVCTQQELLHLAASQDPATEFLKLWTEKEAYVKLLGQGLSYGLKNVCSGKRRQGFHFFQRTIQGICLAAFEQGGGGISLEEMDELS